MWTSGGNQLCNVDVSFRKAGSVQRSKLTRVARSKYNDEERFLFELRNAASRASLGRRGLLYPGSRRPRSTSQFLSRTPRCGQPSVASTCGESLQIQASNSGSMTTAAERPAHPFCARRVSTSTPGRLADSSCHNLRDQTSPVRVWRALAQVGADHDTGGRRTNRGRPPPEGSPRSCGFQGVAER